MEYLGKVKKETCCWSVGIPEKELRPGKAKKNKKKMEWRRVKKPENGSGGVPSYGENLACEVPRCPSR